MNPTLDTLRTLLPGWQVGVPESDLYGDTFSEVYCAMRDDGYYIITVARDDAQWLVILMMRAHIMHRAATLEDAAAYVRDEFGGAK